MSSTTNVITALRAQRRSPDRVNLDIDGEFSCGVAYEVVVAEGLRAGAAITPEVVCAAVACVMNAENVRDADLCAQAASKWLRTCPAPDAGDREAHERRRLAGYLGRRGFSGDAVRAALERL